MDLQAVQTAVLDQRARAFEGWQMLEYKSGIRSIRDLPRVIEIFQLAGSTFRRKKSDHAPRAADQTPLIVLTKDLATRVPERLLESGTVTVDLDWVWQQLLDGGVDPESYGGRQSQTLRDDEETQT